MIRHILEARGFLEHDPVSEARRLEAMTILAASQRELINSRRQRRALQRQAKAAGDQ